MIKAVFISILFIVSVQASAKGSSSADTSELSELSLGIDRTLYLDTYLFTGYTRLEHSSLSSAPQTSQFGIGFTLGAKVSSAFFVALTTDYRTLSQWSEVNENNPNFSGQRFLPIAPVLGLKFDKYLFKIDYQTTGNLEFSKSFPEGTLKLTNPSGYRASFFFDRIFKIPWGIYYENLNYRKKVLSEVGESTLSSQFNVWQFGLMLNILL